MREIPFQGVKFQTFSGGGMPPDPLECALPCFDVPSKIPGSAPVLPDVIVVEVKLHVPTYRLLCLGLTSL